MQQRILPWMNSYLNKPEDILDTDTITMKFWTKNRYNARLWEVGFGNHFPYYAKCWEGIEQEYVLLGQYFGIVNAPHESNRFTYHCPCVDLEKVDKLLQYGTVSVIKDGAYVEIKITQVPAYVEACNEMLVEHLHWCARNHKNVDRNLNLMPSEGFWSGIQFDFATDRQKAIWSQERREKLLQARQQTQQGDPL